MRNTNLAFRTAIINALDAISYNGKNIYPFEEYYQPSGLRVKAVYANFEAYIIVLNQTLNDNSPKCVRNDEVSIQIQINTVWPAGKGGSKSAEEISELIMNRLFTTDGLFKNITIPEPFGLWKMDVLTVRNMNYDENASRVWVTQLVVTASVTQNALV